MPAAPYATSPDLEDRWRTLTDLERPRAEVLLGVAARVIRRSFPDVDLRVAGGTLDPLTLVDVSAAMVRRAFRDAQARDAAGSYTIGPLRVDRPTVNAAEDDVYLTAHDRSMLTAAPATGGGGAVPKGTFPPAVGWPRG